MKKHRKRIISLCAAFLVIFSLVSCKDETSREYGSDYTVKLDSLPDIGEYKKDIPSERFYPEYTNRLYPSDEYGLLLPYAGDTLKYLPSGEKSPLDSTMAWFSSYGMKYGFCTEDGKIVTDAVFSQIQYYDAGYYIISYEDKDGMPMPQILCTETGTVVTELTQRYYMVDYLTDGLFCGTYSLENETDEYGVPLDVIDIFDIYGNVTASVRENASFGSDEYGNIIYLYYGDYEEDAKSWIADASLNKCAGPYADIVSAGGGLFIASDLETGLFGVVDNKGKVIIPMKYNVLSSSPSGELFVGITDGALKKCTPDGGEVTLSDSLTGYCYGIYFVTDDVIEIPTEERNIYVSIEYGEMEYGTVTEANGYLVCRTGKKCTLLDLEHNEIASLVGEYNAYGLQPDDKRFITLECDDKGPGVFDVETGEWVIPEANCSYMFDDDIFARYKNEEDGTCPTDLYFLSVDTKEPYLKSLKTATSANTPVGTLIYSFDGSYTKTVKKDGTVLMKIRTEKD